MHVIRMLGCGLGLVAALQWPAPAQAQQRGGVSRSVDAARRAWLRHDVGSLVSGAEGISLHLPGVAEAPSARPGQAARLLERYLKPATERGLTLRGVRQLTRGDAYAELERRYVVEGTSEERRETLFLGFRLADGQWRLSEVRVTP